MRKVLFIYTNDQFSFLVIIYFVSLFFLFLLSFFFVPPSSLSLACSSMFFDADGDLGHEFYEETVGGTLKRVLEGLVPQGMLALDCPAISPHVRAVILPNHTL